MLLAHNAFMCLYCNEIHRFVDLSLDHAVPISRGGTNADDNIKLSCKRMNQAKGDLTYGEFTALLVLMAGWEERPKNSVISRLRFGGRMFFVSKVKK